MFTHTMLVSFENQISDADLDQFLSDIENSMKETGVVRRYSARRHVPVAGEEAIPAFIATAVLEFGVDTVEDLATMFAAPGAGEVIHTWQARHPYKVAWVNHETGA
ncbi:MULTISPECIES: hypothetical protein [Streptomyces]|uniref:hypothetical protein n=1 Tax=Streptomyces TaxID=1883 RepID=UPI00109E37A6|nr:MULTISPECIES: hypothetical protein [unclassified Streptomyces]MBJ6623135.1 hypothetical protein [Streptomyces sp. DHE17-7]QCB26347.1 hypothetical protein E5N77_34320 [Streptomyces sp. SS52]